MKKNPAIHLPFLDDRIRPAQPFEEKSNGHSLNGNSALIELHRVTKVYKNAAGEFTALKSVDLKVDRGEFVAVVGKSGSGKSTLINMITGIDRPTSGEVYIGDTPVHTLNENRMAAWRGIQLGIVFQFFQLLPTLTVIENVMLPMDFCNKYDRYEREVWAMHLLEQVGMGEHAFKLPSAISGGQQQRVAIARALANDPPILVADEPTGNLDSITAEAIFLLFEDLVARGKTIFMVTHDQDLARRITRTISLADGQIVSDQLAEASDYVKKKRARMKRESIFKQEAQEVAISTILSKVDEILEDRSTAVRRLREEVLNIPREGHMAEVAYQALLEDFDRRAENARAAGQQEEARALWKLLSDATEPWASPEIDRGLQ